MLNSVFTPWPCFSKEEIDAVASVLQSNKVNYWTGTEGRSFENEFSAWVGSEHSIAVANGTLALDLALKALNIGHDDEVITTPRTFLASASSIVTAGATPKFADVDLNSQNITASSIEAVLSKKTKAVIVVHLGGMPAEMDEIMELSKEHGFYVIEDCAQAHGAVYKGRSVGTIGHVGAWSFCQDKIMTTGGEGGMVTTNSKELWSRMWSYKDHGKSYEAVFERQHPKGFRWLHESFGTNWRMTEMQAAIGRIQLKKMSEWGAIRRKYGEMLDNIAKDFSCIRTVVVPDYMRHAEYKHYFFVNNDSLASGWSRDRIIDEISRLGVPCMQGSCPEVYLEKAFENTGWCPQKRLPNAKLLGETSLMMLVHPSLKLFEVERMCEVLKEVLQHASV